MLIKHLLIQRKVCTVEILMLQMKISSKHQLSVSWMVNNQNNEDGRLAPGAAGRRLGVGAGPAEGRAVRQSLLR